MSDFESRRATMVETQLRRRGITAQNVLDAFRKVPREEFIPPELAEFAYQDTPLPIGQGQTISQPYIVAVTLNALELRGGERVLEVGAGSGYAAALLGAMAREVYTIERVPELAERARARLARLACDNVHVIEGDGSLGCPEHAPYDAIAVAAAGPRVPEALLEQLAPGGRLVMPVGDDAQILIRVRRDEHGAVEEDTLTDVRFVPLIGAQGFGEDRPRAGRQKIGRPPATGVRALIRETAETFGSLTDAPIEALLDRVGEARLVLLGEATHGTREFYAMRDRITRELVTQRGFSFVAVEADWPDAARVDDFVLGGAPRSSLQFTPFSRFPTWMWRNREVSDFVHWLRAENSTRKDGKVGFHGLDLYSLFTSMASVLAYLDDVDARAAAVARHRYGALTPWQKDPAAYGRAVLAGRYESSEAHVVAMLKDMLARRLDYTARDGERFFDAAQNARVVADAEGYYRAMYFRSAMSWNLRDRHMFDTLSSLLSFYGPRSKGVVWAHNSHVGDARATEMNARGELNLGQLCREVFGDAMYAIGFGTDHGTVAAAPEWDAPVQAMVVRPAREGSYESLFHETGMPAFSLPLRHSKRAALREELAPERLERAIGVIYRPQSELASHYFHATLPEQFDEYVWFDATTAVTPLAAPNAEALRELPETYPFGL